MFTLLINFSCSNNNLENSGSLVNSENKQIYGENLVTYSSGCKEFTNKNKPDEIIHTDTSYIEYKYQKGLLYYEETSRQSGLVHHIPI